MNVTINKKELQIFKGACLGDVVLAYSKRSFKLLHSGYYSIIDKYGNVTEADGPAHEGQIIYLKRSKNLTISL